MLRYSEKVRNAALDARVTAIGPSPTLHICGKDGEPLVSIVLPHVWMGKAANGVVQKAGEWQAVAHKTGEPASFRISAEDGNHVDGAIPGDMTLDHPKIERGQAVVVGRFTLSSGNMSVSG